MVLRASPHPSADGNVSSEGSPTKDVESLSASFSGRRLRQERVQLARVVESLSASFSGRKLRLKSLPREAKLRASPHPSADGNLATSAVAAALHREPLRIRQRTETVRILLPRPAKVESLSASFSGRKRSCAAIPASARVESLSAFFSGRKPEGRDLRRAEAVVEVESLSASISGRKTKPVVAVASLELRASPHPSADGNSATSRDTSLPAEASVERLSTR